MNLEKKRKRQNGRQGGVQSESQIAYQKGYFDGQAKVIQDMIDNGVLPPVSFDKVREVKSV